ncbi:hypothetical protein, partial [Escherichia coli]|uniref:hypothetical protein n=1 Tax=Escherichia coli TaxID=562 RepID=UPI001BC855B1
HTNNSCLKSQQDKKSVFTATSVFTVLHQVYRYKKPAQWRVAITAIYLLIMPLLTFIFDI